MKNVPDCSSRHFTQNQKAFRLSDISSKTSRDKISIKRIPLSVFRKRNHALQASMTVEAAVVLPLLLFFFLNLSSAIEMLRVHGKLELALWETGNRLSVYSYALEEITGKPSGEEIRQDPALSERLAGILLSYLYVKDEVVGYIGRKYLKQSPVAGGEDGLNFLESSFLKSGECIHLVLTYQTELPFPVIGFPSFRMANQYYGRAWTGYDVLAASDPETNQTYVYITETGSVYHETKECSHLKLSIQSISLGEVARMTNTSGSHYTACHLCKKEGGGDIVYITTNGERYHYLIGCSGLKRTIYRIKRTEAAGYRPCGRCGVSSGGA
jgi:hypothetical protein